MSILLTVLIIILKVLLVILCIILFLAALILLVPLQYRVEGEYRNGAMKGDGVVSWMHIVTLSFLFRKGCPDTPDSRMMSIRVFGFDRAAWKKQRAIEKKEREKKRRTAEGRGPAEETPKGGRETQEGRRSPEEKGRGQASKGSGAGGAESCQRESGKTAAARAAFHKLPLPLSEGGRGNRSGSGQTDLQSRVRPDPDYLEHPVHAGSCRG